MFLSLISAICYIHTFVKSLAKYIEFIFCFIVWRLCFKLLAQKYSCVYSAHYRLISVISQELQLHKQPLLETN